MMAKPRSLVMDYLVYLLVRVTVCVLQMLSLRAACKAAAGLAWLAYQLDRRHRLVADDNLRQAFPGRYTDAQRDQLVRAVYRHFCTLLMEMLHTPRRFTLSTWHRHLQLKQCAPVLELVLAGRPVLMLTGHLGNWELGGYYMGMAGFPMHAIARPLDNPFLDRFLKKFREHTGQHLLPKKGSFDPMQAVLAQGGMLATLGDQDAGQRGLYVNFCGRPASTHKAIALLALQFNVPIAILAAVRTGGPLEYDGLVEDLILPEDYQDDPDAVRSITQRFTTALEQIINRHPEQYFWLHRRWKHQPKARAAKKVA
jgi:KDO2-lipid IV(A) lauroyltransferase